MRAIQLNSLQGPGALTPVEIPRPNPTGNDILIEVRAAGINFAELEMTHGRYSAHQPLPFVMGWEAAGTVVEVGPQVNNFKPGDRVTSVVSSGGYAEYALADSSMAISVPDGISFAQATAIPIQGLSAITLLKLAARPQPNETVLIEAAAGGVGLFLVQLSKRMGAKRVIALASTRDKLALVKNLGADVTINYSERGWTDQVLAATDGRGADVILESVSGAIADEAFKLLAPFGRIVFFGARNAHDVLSEEKVRQLILKNQSLIGFNFPSLPPDSIGASIPELLELIRTGQVKLFAEQSFPLERVQDAFAAIANRLTVGKVSLVP